MSGDQRLRGVQLHSVSFQPDSIQTVALQGIRCESWSDWKIVGAIIRERHAEFLKDAIDSSFPGLLKCRSFVGVR